MATLLGAEGYKLLEKYKIPVAKYSIIKNKTDLLNFSKKQGFPIVIKAISSQLVHKTESGAIKIASSEDEAGKAFDAMKRLGGYILVQKFVPGTEVIIGAKHDATFGKVVLFGGGGILVELMKDVSFRACPITKKDADDMINEVKASVLLKGFRAAKPANISAIKEILMKVCVLAERENIQELDINPVIVNSETAAAVDVRILT
jgi:acyl-CoA synthetase (NDP forming)